MPTALLHRIFRPSYGTEFWDCLRVENGGRARQLCIPPSFVVWIALIAIACFIYQAKWLWWLLSCQIMTLFKVAYNEMYHMYVCTHNRTLFILVCKLTSRVWLALVFGWIINLNYICLKHMFFSLDQELITKHQMSAEVFVLKREKGYFCEKWNEMTQQKLWLTFYYV